MTLKKVIGIICVLIAFCLLVIPPLVSNIKIEQNEKEKDNLLEEINDLINSEVSNKPSTSDTSNNTTGNVPETLLPIVDTTTVPDTSTDSPQPTEPEPYKPYRTSTNEEVDGILYIPCIDLELPILTNVTDKGLNKTCARVTNTCAPGCNNYCIMGHVMKKYGYVFNRLHEVKIGDTISVKARDYTYNYVVTEIFITEGLDTNILEDVEGKQLITLFCCSYQVNNGRLVVRGELKSINYN